MGNPIGAVRSTLLLARVRPSRIMAARSRRLVGAVRGRTPDLRTCPRLHEIISRWGEWAAGEQPELHGDPFWLL
jgi:hypothetical protein